MNYIFEKDDNDYDFEYNPTQKEIREAIADLLSQNTINDKLTKPELLKLYTEMIYNNDLEDCLEEFFSEELKEYFESDAYNEFEESFQCGNDEDFDWRRSR